MKTALSFLLACLTCTVAVASSSRQQAAAPQPTVATDAANDPAAGLFSQMCNKCHDGARITAVRRSSTEWEEVLNKMIERGAMGSEKEFETVYDYLRRYFGKLYINNAPPDEIVTILGLSKKDAEAIVAYRKANGSFADFDAVKKVPDIDVKQLEARKEAVAF
jgi:competence protein ComEA